MRDKSVFGSRNVDFLDMIGIYFIVMFPSIMILWIITFLISFLHIFSLYFACS